MILLHGEISVYEYGRIASDIDRFPDLKSTFIEMMEDDKISILERMKFGGLIKKKTKEFYINNLRKKVQGGNQ